MTFRSSVAIVLLLIAPAAEAQLAYEAPAECPEREALVHLVQARTEAPFPDGAGLHFVLTVEGSAPHYRASLTALRPDTEVPIGVRELAANDCGELIESLALTIATIVTDFRASEVVSPPGQANSTPFGPEPPPVEWPAEAPRTRNARTVWLVEAGPSLTFGRLPAGSVGADLGIGYWTDDFVLQVQGGASTLLGQANPNRTDSIEASAFHLALRPCVNFEPLELCASIQGGVFSALILSAREEQERTSAFMDVGLAAQARIPLNDDWFVLPWAVLSANVLRPALRIGGEQIWVTPPLGAQFGARVGVGIH